MLASSHLIGFASVTEAAGAPASLAFQSQYNDSGDLSSYTFSGAALGTAAATRRIVVAVGVANSTPPTVTALTVAGVSAASPVAQLGAAGAFRVSSSIWIADVPTGTTGDIVITLSGASFRCGIGVWAVYDLASSTATATGSSTSSTASENVNVSAGGVLIGYSCSFTSGSARSYTWVGPTEDFDVAFDSNNHSNSGASAAYASAQSPLAISSTPSSAATNSAHVFAAFR